MSAWLAADPIELFKPLMVADDRIGAGRVAEIEAEVKATIADAVAFAQDSPSPDTTRVLEDVYA